MLKRLVMCCVLCAIVATLSLSLCGCKKKAAGGGDATGSVPAESKAMMEKNYSKIGQSGPGAPAGKSAPAKGN